MPKVSAIVFPKAYGAKPGQTLDWAEIRSRLEAAPTYWLATVRGDGRPHTVPLDGVWVDDVWWYGGAEETIHVRTVIDNPHAVMHLPDPGEAVIVEGVVRRTSTEPDLADRIATSANAKYGYGQDASEYAEVLGLYPARILAWSMLQNATRFEFG